jgi:thiol-disulfide isomerase/thioredoxin
MKKLIVLIGFVLFISSQLSSQITIQGKVTKLAPNTTRIVLVEMWYLDKWRQLDSTTLNAAGYFRKKIMPSYGQCRLRVWGESKAWLDFIYPKPSPKDTLLDFGQLNMGLMTGGTAYLDGAENEAYYQLTSAQRRLQIKKDSITAIMSSIVGVESSTLEKLNALNAAQEKVIVDFNNYYKDIAKKYPGTFSADIVAKLFQTPCPSEYPEAEQKKYATKDLFSQKYQLDRIPFSDLRILYHNGTVKAINAFQDKCYVNNAEGMKAFIDRVFEHRNGVEEVDNWFFKYLLNRFLDYKNEDAVSHLLKFYAPDCSSEDTHIGDGLKSLVLALKSCEPGKMMHEMSFPDKDSKQHSLMETCTKNKMTLLMFWKSNCSHCKEFEPVLAELYKKYKPLGLEVIGISQDKDSMEWKTFLAQNPQIPWFNVLMDDAKRKECNLNFPVPGTPTLIAIDGKGVVMNRMVVRNSLESYLEEEFAKMK